MNRLPPKQEDLTQLSDIELDAWSRDLDVSIFKHKQRLAALESQTAIENSRFFNRSIACFTVVMVLIIAGEWTSETETGAYVRDIAIQTFNDAKRVVFGVEDKCPHGGEALRTKDGKIFACLRGPVRDNTPN